MRLYFAAGCEGLYEVTRAKYANAPWRKKLVKHGAGASLFDTFLAHKGDSQRDLYGVVRNMIGNDGWITCDSGAYTVFAALGLTTTVGAKKLPFGGDYDAYFKAYLEWAVDNEQNVDYFVELDLQELVGRKKVDEWLRLWQKAGLAHRVIRVWHGNVDSARDFEDMCATTPSRYIAIEGLRPGRAALPYREMALRAYSEQCRLHGLALCNSSVLLQAPFYSVDSSSYLGPRRFGSFIFYDPRKFAVQTCRNPQEALRRGLLTPDDMATLAQTGKGAPWGMRGGKVRFVHGIGEYRKMEKHLTALWKARGIDWSKLDKGGVCLGLRS